jgi:hypothetical protein
VRFYLHAPIPPPRLWVASLEAEPPPGYLRLAGATIAPRASAASTFGADLVPADALPSDISRLLQAFQRLDAAGRGEVLHHAEQLAEAAL